MSDLKDLCSSQNRNRLYPSLMTLLLAPINDAIANPTGKWEDFNPLYNAYDVIKFSADTGNGKNTFCPEDVPAEPNPDDYPEINNE